MRMTFVSAKPYFAIASKVALTSWRFRDSRSAGNDGRPGRARPNVGLWLLGFGDVFKIPLTAQKHYYLCSLRLAINAACIVVYLGPNHHVSATFHERRVPELSALHPLSIRIVQWELLHPGGPHFAKDFDFESPILLPNFRRHVTHGHALIDVVRIAA